MGVKSQVSASESVSARPGGACPKSMFHGASRVRMFSVCKRALHVLCVSSC